MTLKKWHENPNLKDELSKLVYGNTALTHAISVMKDKNRPAPVEYKNEAGVIDDQAHTISHAMQFGYDLAIRDLETNLLKSTIEHKPIVQKAYEYIKDKVHDLPTLIPTRK